MRTKTAIVLNTGALRKSVCFVGRIRWQKRRSPMSGAIYSACFGSWPAVRPVDVFSCERDAGLKYYQRAFYFAQKRIGRKATADAQNAENPLHCAGDDFAYIYFPLISRRWRIKGGLIETLWGAVQNCTMANLFMTLFRRRFLRSKIKYTP
jgi:hypothetical protein